MAYGILGDSARTSRTANSMVLLETNYRRVTNAARDRRHTMHDLSIMYSSISNLPTRPHQPVPDYIDQLASLEIEFSGTFTRTVIPRSAAPTQ